MSLASFTISRCKDARWSMRPMGALCGTFPSALILALLFFMPAARADDFRIGIGHFQGQSLVASGSITVTHACVVADYCTMADIQAFTFWAVIPDHGIRTWTLADLQQGNAISFIPSYHGIFFIGGFSNFAFFIQEGEGVFDRLTFDKDGNVDVTESDLPDHTNPRGNSGYYGLQGPQTPGKLIGQGTSSVGHMNGHSCPGSCPGSSSCSDKPDPTPTTTGQASCGDPVDIATGNKTEVIVDYETNTPDRLAFMRFYNSQAAGLTSLGQAWRSNFDRSFLIQSPLLITLTRINGQVITFTLSGSSWQADSDVDVTLSHSGTGVGSTWTVTDSSDTAETYLQSDSASARLTSIRARNGYTQNLNYAGTDLLSVTDSRNRTLSFVYQNALLQSVNTPDNLTITFGYEPIGGISVPSRLKSVSYSTSPVTSQQYLYESDTNFNLKSIVDENGNQFAAWSYVGYGQANSSQHAGGADLTQVAYNSNGTRTVTNALGQQEEYTFTTLQGVPKVTQIARVATATTAAATRTFTYDSNGYMASQADWNGNLTTYVNDSHGQVTSVTEAAGTPQARTTTVTYHPTFHLPVQVVEPGVTTDFSYDSDGNVLTKTLTDTTTTTVPYSTSGIKRVWTYAWSNGLLASVKDPRNNATRFAYDGSGTLIGTTDALGHVTHVTQHTPGGLPQTIVDANGVTTQLTYDARLRLAASTVNTGGGVLTTTYTYDQAGNLLGTTLPDGSQLTNTYDAAHRLRAITDLFSQTTAYTLNLLGDTTQSDVKDSSSVTKLTRSGSFDALGRILQDTGGAGQVMKYAYDGNGNAVTLTDPLNRVTTQAFDALNRRFRVTDPANGITSMTFDAHDRPLSVTAPNGAVTTYVYDGFGDLIQEISPDRGKTIYRYDAGGNLTQKTDATGAVTNFTYDALNRVLTTTYPAAPAENVTYVYDEPGHGFGVERLTSVTDAVGTLSRFYDERGNLLSETRVRNGTTLLTTYTYDAASRTKSITYPSGLAVNYLRDAMGRITSVSAKPTAAPSPVPVVSNIAYQPFGPMNAMTFGNGVAETRSFDLDYRLTNLADTGVAAIQNLTYGYNVVDNVLSIADTVHPANSQSFGYDALDRLTSASGVYGPLAYTYDSVGNRLTQQAGSRATTYVYTPQSNRLTQVKTGTATQVLAYTPAGNVTTVANVPSTRPATGIAYNQAGRLATVLSGGQQAMQYTYDAFGQRIVKVSPTLAMSLFQYDQAGHLLEVTNAQGVFKLDYIYLGDQPIATYAASSGKLAFLHSDQLGTPQVATDTNQTVVWLANYQPFGMIDGASSQTATLAQDLRFPGQEFEVETGWHHNGFRDYVPNLGRYLESDPIGLKGGANTYAYGEANPERWADPTGLAVQAYAGYYGAHAVVKIDTSKGPVWFGFAPINNALEPLSFLPVPGRIREESQPTPVALFPNGYQALSIPNGDRLVATLRALKDRVFVYHLLLHNCYTFASEVKAFASGIENPEVRNDVRYQLIFGQ